MQNENLSTLIKAFIEELFANEICIMDSDTIATIELFVKYIYFEGYCSGIEDSQCEESDD